MWVEILITVVSTIQYLFRILGPALSGIGALMVIYSDIAYPKVQRWLRRFAPSIARVEQAHDAFDTQSRVQDREAVDTLEELFKKRYDISPVGDRADEVQRVSTGMKFEYPGGSTRSPFNERETWRLEERLFFTWAKDRYAARAGMLYMVAGFAVVILGTL